MVKPSFGRTVLLGDINDPDTEINVRALKQRSRTPTNPLPPICKRSSILATIEEEPSRLQRRENAKQLAQQVAVALQLAIGQDLSRLESAILVRPVSIRVCLLTSAGPPPIDGACVSCSSDSSFAPDNNERLSPTLNPDSPVPETTKPSPVASEEAIDSLASRLSEQEL